MLIWLKRNYFCVGFGALLFLFALSLPNRALNIDDPWLAETSYWVAKVGYARSTLLWGINNYEILDLNYHKLWVLIGALFWKTFGFTVTVFKSVGLLFFFIFLVGFYYYFRDREKEYSLRDFWIGAFLIWSTNLVFNYSFVFRPEIGIMAVGFWGFFFFRKSILQSNWKKMLVAGLLFGLCVPLHIKGSVYPMTAGLFLLLFHRHLKSILALGIGVVAGILPYFWDITSIERLQFWYKQFSNNPVVHSMPKTIWYYILKPLQEHKRFFHQEHEIAFSLLFFVCLLIFYKPLKKYLDIEVKFLFLTVIGMGATSHSMTDKSLLLYYPFMVLVVVTALKIMPVKSRTIPILLALSLLVNMAMNIRLVLKSDRNVAQRSAIAAAQIGKKNVKVMADISFIFNEMDNYEIYGAQNYTFTCAFYTGEIPTIDRYFEYAKKFGVEFIVFDTVSMSGEEEELFKNVDLSVGKEVKNFRVKYNYDGITVLEKFKELDLAEKS
ncbi:MAG: hypothetical protein A4S09_02360 [Proteobacteria bacterium SG_bin7]|nr:MAG: hypothetical protein A4S09_02360 [Proteobacteria bacterium SG_bin7]